MNQTMRPKSKSGRAFRLVLSFLFCVAVLHILAGPAAAQQKDKKKKDAPASDGKPTIPMGDEQQIDYMVSSMLGAWQVGDVDKLHQSYADDVTMVSGAWAPPVVGWTNYSLLYQQQRARMLQVRMDRTNTLIRVAGTVAWACYQWDFSATVDGQPSEARGQTTLVIEKRNDRWLIVHNHTAVLQTAAPAVPGNTPPATQPPPAKPASR